MDKIEELELQHANLMERKIFQPYNWTLDEKIELIRKQIRALKKEVKNG